MNRKVQAAFRKLMMTISSIIFVGGAFAQDYEITWYTIDGGGETVSAGGGYELGGTIGQPDAGELSGGNYSVTGGFWAATFRDCNDNGVPDSLDIALGTSQDCNENGVPDECEVPPLCPDCPDCNENEVPDECDIAEGTSEDCQPNGIPDECEGGPWYYADVDGNGDVNLTDLLCMLDGVSGLLTCPGVTFEDLDIDPCDQGNDDINLIDLLNLLDALAGMPPCPDPCP